MLLNDNYLFEFVFTHQLNLKGDRDLLYYKALCRDLVVDRPSNNQIYHSDFLSWGHFYQFCNMPASVCNLQIFLRAQFNTFK